MVFAEIEPLHGKMKAGMCMLAFENEKEFFELFYKAGAESRDDEVSKLKLEVSDLKTLTHNLLGWLEDRRIIEDNEN